MNSDKLYKWLESTSYLISKDDFIKQLKNITNLKSQGTLDYIWEEYEKIHFEERLNNERLQKLNNLLNEKN